MEAFRSRIEEIQGLYGPFMLSERVVQKLWLRGEYDASDLRTSTGRSLRVKDPGRWNLQEGPDFKEARLVIDGIEVVGDVEIHFYTSDWWAHGHGEDPNYHRVVLHVVLYPEKGASGGVFTHKGRQTETLYLMPYLEHDLEHYANEEALRELERVDELEWVAGFLERPVSERLTILYDEADRRWKAKRAFARTRLDRSSWEEACHQACLEVLGYARNRAPMSTLALRHPLAAWRKEAPIPEALFESCAEAWRLSGVRPANHPRQRLRQYAAIVEAQPEWPALLADRIGALPDLSVSRGTAAFRREAGLNTWIRQVGAEIFAGQLGAKRLNTLLVDALLPLAGARGLRVARPYWMHWPMGDVPEALLRFLKHAGLPARNNPRSNGLAQGGLALFFAQGRAGG